MKNIGSTEGLTGKEAESIMPVLYDSSLSSKNKISDLLGIPINDASFNQILNAENKDPDAIIATIKKFIGSSITFNTPTSAEPSTKSREMTTLDTPTTTTPATTDATTTQPISLKHTSFKDRLYPAEKNTTK